MPGLTSRIDALESSIGTEPPDRCGVCGAGEWTTFRCIDADGRQRWACMHCLSDRERPTRGAPRFPIPVELWKAISA